MATWRPREGDERNAHPLTVPLFLPLPAKPGPSSTPAHMPCLPSISPTKRRVPSKPRDSIRTLSPTSKVRPARLTLRVNTSDALLAGRGSVAFSRGAELDVDETEVATEDGRLEFEDATLDGARDDVELALTSLTRGPL
jgi:hypothetical protein